MNTVFYCCLSCSLVCKFKLTVTIYSKSGAAGLLLARIYCESAQLHCFAGGVGHAHGTARPGSALPCARVPPTRSLF